jgi:hypothetical protein
MALFPILNEYILFTSVICLIVLIVWEYYDTALLLSFETKSPAQVRAESNEVSHSNNEEEEIIAVAPAVIESENQEIELLDKAVSPAGPSSVSETDGATDIEESVISERTLEEPPASVSVPTTTSTSSNSESQEASEVAEKIPHKIVREISVTEPSKPVDEIAIETKEQTLALVRKIMDPMAAGCEPFGANANTMAEKLPALKRSDITRYLVARKGNIAQATEMAEKCLAWRASVFPLKKAELAAALNTNCFFTFKNAIDGTPVVYMRGGLYDSSVASPEHFVLAAAHAIEWSLKCNPDQINVTVVCDTTIIPGAPNLGADMNFIKPFVKVSHFLYVFVHVVFIY